MQLNYGVRDGPKCFIPGGHEGKTTRGECSTTRLVELLSHTQVKRAGDHGHLLKPG